MTEPEYDESAYRVDFMRWTQTLAKSSVTELADRLASHRAVEIDSGLAYHRAHVYARPEKIAAREMVVAAFDRTYRNNALRILTMPGALWHFEERLLDAREGKMWRARPYTQRTHIIGIERNEYLYRAGVLKAPCSTHAIVHLEAPAWSTGSLRLGPIKQYHRAALEDVDFVALAPINGAWLDFSGPLTLDALAAVERLWELPSMGRLIVTAMAARWPMGDFDTRAWMSGLEEATIFHEHRYISGVVPMLQIGIEKPVRSMDIHAPKAPEVFGAPPEVFGPHTPWWLRQGRVREGGRWIKRGEG